MFVSLEGRRINDASKVVTFNMQTTLDFIGHADTLCELFTDIDQLQTGDKFYLHILDKVLAYEVDQILPMVDKDDHQTLQNALSITEGQDYVSLFTCTPYGVNSHRLIVRGHRVEYNGEEDVKQSVGDRMLESIKNYYMLILVLGLSITILVIIIMRYVFNKKK